MSLWKEHKGLESCRADLDAQWNQRIIGEMQYMLDKHKPKDVTNISTDGGTILSALTRPHSACALLAYLANLADTSPYPYISLSCKHPCYACYAFFIAYNRADPQLPFYIQSPRYQFYIPFAFPAFSDHDLHNAVRLQMNTVVKDDLWAIWDEWQDYWRSFNLDPEEDDADDDDPWKAAS